MKHLLSSMLYGTVATLFIPIPFHLPASSTVAETLKLYFSEVPVAGVVGGISFTSEKHLQVIWKTEVS